MKSPVLVATTGALPACTYATLALTASANGELAIDGIQPLAATTRVLVTSQADDTQNGIYVVTDPGGASAPWVLTRSDDFNDTSKIFTGVKVHVVKGTSYGDTTFVLVTDNPVLDSTALEFILDTGKLVLIKEKTGNISGFSGNTTLSYPFSHGWNTRKVTVDIIDAISYETVYTNVARTSDNAITVYFDNAPQDNEDYIVLMRAEVA
jgi:hypothetical protein